MAYWFKGKLCGFICAERSEPLAKVRVRLYRSREGQNVAALAVAHPKETFAALTEEMVKEKEPFLLAEAETDDEGNFTFELQEREGKEGGYGGEAFELDIYCESVPHQKIGRRPPKPRQFTITTLQPLWRESEDGYRWWWEYCLSERIWCLIRSLFGAWVIFGRVIGCRSQRPVSGVKVSAIDADWIADDPLGTATTDAQGQFRIDYAAADFHKTFLSPWINLETPWPPWDSGPDLYFRIETAGGSPLLTEGRPDGHRPGRENVGPCVCIELCVEKEPEVLVGVIDTPTAGACVQSTVVPACITSGAPLIGIAITGTADGPPFNHYTLRYSWGANPPIQDAIVYPNCSRPPASPSSSVPVTAGILGYLDVSLLPAGQTEFTVYLEVVGAAPTVSPPPRTFGLRTTAVEISAVAKQHALVAHDPFNTGSITKLIKATNDPNLAVPEISIGGAFSVDGSAYTIGCDRIMSQFGLVRFDAPATAPVPNFPDATGGTPLISPVVYADIPDHPWQTSCLRSTFSPPSCETVTTDNTIRNGDLVAQWSVEHCGCVFMAPPLDDYTVPKVEAIPSWNSGSLNGRFVILLEVRDRLLPAGPFPGDFARKDQVVVWIDNKAPVGKINSIGGVAGCGDLHLKDYVGTNAEIRGVAWDPPIDASIDPDPITPKRRPNDNFGSYSLAFQKNGESSSGVISAATPTTRVPNTWANSLPAGAEGLLANWDIVADLDAGPPPNPLPAVWPPPHKLLRNERCAYVITLVVSDTTHVGDSGGGHSTGVIMYAINVINDIP